MKIFLSFLFVIFYFYFLLFSENGFLKTEKIENKVLSLEESIKSVEIENENLSKKKYKLLSDSSFLEKEKGIWNQISNQAHILKFELVKSESIEPIEPIYSDFNSIKDLNFTYVIFTFSLFCIFVAFLKLFFNFEFNKNKIERDYDY